MVPPTKMEKDYKNALNGIIAIVVLVFAVAYFFSIINYYFPSAKNFNCPDFADTNQAQIIFHRYGGPELDPFGLDHNHDGIACNIPPPKFHKVKVLTDK